MVCKTNNEIDFYSVNCFIVKLHHDGDDSYNPHSSFGI